MPMTRPVPTHASAISCTVPSPPTATTGTSPGNPPTMRPAWPGPSVTCQTGRTPRPSRNPETNSRNPPARPLPADGLSTRCASPPPKSTAGKYQNRNLAARTSNYSSYTSGIAHGTVRRMQASSKGVSRHRNPRHGHSTFEHVATQHIRFYG
jgi:hypothetical protein